MSEKIWSLNNFVYLCNPNRKRGSVHKKNNRMVS